MFVVTLHYTQPISEIDNYIVPHREFLDRYYASGHLICSGPKNPRDGGVILAKADSRAELEAILAQDPFKQHNLAEYTVIEFDPIKSSPAFKSCL